MASVLPIHQYRALGVAHYAVGGGADEVVVDIGNVRGNHDEVSTVAFRRGKDAVGGRAVADFDGGRNAGLGDEAVQPVATFLHGILDDVSRKLHGDIGRNILDDIDEDDLAAIIEQLCRPAENLL